jgi:flagellar biogenesis protein FliO
MDATALAGICVVFGLFGLLLFTLKRGGMATFSAGLLPKRTDTRDLEVLERISLTPTHSLHLVKARGRTLLISTAPQACHCLAELDAGVKECGR